MFTCLHVYMFTCLHVYMFTCLHVYMFTCLHVYMFTCLYVYMFCYFKRAQSEHEQLVKQQKQVAENLEHQSAQLCVPDPDPSGVLCVYESKLYHAAPL